MSKCIPCEEARKEDILSTESLHERVAAMPLWSVQTKKIIRQTNNEHRTIFQDAMRMNIIRRSFTAKNFQCAMDFLQEAGEVCEAEGHHADFHLVSYREIIVEFYTHKVGGVTEEDLRVAAVLDAKVKPVYSPKWARENGLA